VGSIQHFFFSTTPLLVAILKFWQLRFFTSICITEKRRWYRCLSTYSP